MLAQNLKIEQMRNAIKEFIQLVKIIVKIIVKILVKILVKGVGKRNVFATPKLSPSKAKLATGEMYSDFKVFGFQ